MVADLLAKKPPHEQAIRQIEAERLAFQQDLAQREEACLRHFISSSCMEEIRREHLTRMREFDQRREQARQALREIDAEIRAHERARRIADRDARQKSPAGSAAGEKSGS